MERSGLFDAKGHAVPLLGVEVDAQVLAGHACAVVRQRYKNQEAKPIEAVYTFPLPTKAILTGFAMTTVGGRVEGEVYEREEAFRKYDDALTAGHGGALLEQERPNVFTANVGNVLPGEETVIELTYVEPLLADEGAVRWSIPTLVAPRYSPPSVSDAERISPPIGAVSYGLRLTLDVDLGVPVDIESPSHAVVVTGKRVTFSQAEVALDRDVVVTAIAKENVAIAGAVAHRQGEQGAVAITLVPDLGGQTRRKSQPAEIVFVLDRSGSMGGASMPEARTALRLCLRQLREGDRFSILAFDDSIEAFAPQSVPFTQATLQRADAWLETVEARGGTELLAPMKQAAELAPSGIIVLITDGEVGNEDEILTAFMAAQKGARVYSFGIGTNVSDALLAALADKTGGAVERIHPGERVDDKVVAQFARATAPRVTDLAIKTRGIELGEVAPSEPKALVDSEPFTLFATYEAPGIGAVEIRGKLDGEAFYLEIPVELPERSDRPFVEKLWAQARIRELEHAVVTGRRADAMKERIIKLAKAHGVSSKYTSFVVVEKRTGDRRATTQAEGRVVPVNAPAGWSMHGRSRHAAARGGGVMPMIVPMPAAMSPSPMASMPMARSMAPRPAMGAPPPSASRSAPSTLPPPPSASYAFAEDDDAARSMAPMRAKGSGYGAPARDEGDAAEPNDPLRVILGQQRASGLWEEPGKDAVLVTTQALFELLCLGMTTTHPVFGAQLKKAVEALLDALAKPVEPRLAELGLQVAWLLSGRRTRQAIEASLRARGLPAPVDESALRQQVESGAATVL